VANKLNEFGFDAAVLLYHLRADNEPKQEAWDLALSNAKTALTVLQKRGAEFGMSTQKIGIIGFSAGGHLAARLAYSTAESSPPDFLAMIYPGNGGKVVTDVDFAPGTTPTYLYVAADDKNPLATCIAYDAACKLKKVHCELHIAPSGGHGFGLRESLSPNVKDWPDKLKIFIDGL
jgi:acetyl esterase/lipase